MRIKTALVLGSLLFFVAACGDEADDGGVASADGATESTSEEGSDDAPGDAFEQALQYSECMRENGVEEFPDPEKRENGGVSLGLPPGLDPQSEAFKAAEEACKELQPGPGEGQAIDPERLEEMREYSECMRENGIDNFPDPGPDGGIRLDPNELGVDPTGPEMQAAEEACRSLQPGGGPGQDQQEDA